MTNFTNLEQFGWDKFFEEQFQRYSTEDYSVGRVSIENKNNYHLYTDSGELIAEVSGKFHFNAETASGYPAVGDWVVIRTISDERKAIIEYVLERKNKFSRNAAGIKTEEQIITSNIDTLFIITSLNQDINLRRMERYLALAYECEVMPVLIFSKADLCDEIAEKISEVNSVSLNTKIHIISAVRNEGMSELKIYFHGNKTVGVVGSSGVGKSTLINSLCGNEVMEVSDISLYKDKGRHTTTHRELILLPFGGMIIDTPGMRELQMWEGSDGVSETFSDIEKYLGQCRFSDCKHETEPGCAIKKAIEDGEFDEKRFKNYLKLQREIRHFENRNDRKAMLAEKKKWKKITAEAKKRSKEKYK